MALVCSTSDSEAQLTHQASSAHLTSSFLPLPSLLFLVVWGSERMVLPEE